MSVGGALRGAAAARFLTSARWAVPDNWRQLGSALGPRLVALYVWGGVQGARPALFNCRLLETKKAALWPPSVALVGCWFT